MDCYVKVKGKDVPVHFCWAPRHEGVLGEWMYSSTHSSSSALDGGEWLASRLGRFIHRERDSRTHWIGGWMDPRTILGHDMKYKYKIYLFIW